MMKTPGGKGKRQSLFAESWVNAETIGTVRFFWVQRKNVSLKE